MPLKLDVYQQLKREKVFEDFLRPEKISNITGLHKGVFFAYSLFATSVNVAHQTFIHGLKYFAKLETKKGYLISSYSTITDEKYYYYNLRMKQIKVYTQKHKEAVPILYELAIDDMLTPLRSAGALEWLTGENNKKTGLPYPAKEDKPSYSLSRKTPLSVGGISLSVDKRKHDGREMLKIETCQNPECALHNITSKGNIISYGTYRTKAGVLSRRFICKECGKSFSPRIAGIFYSLFGLRSPEKKILKALELLIKGMPLRGVANTIGTKPYTIKHWLKVVAEQSWEIDAMLKRELKVSQAELDVLWAHIKENSLHRRAVLWKSSF